MNTLPARLREWLEATYIDTIDSRIDQTNSDLDAAETEAEERAAATAIMGL